MCVCARAPAQQIASERVVIVVVAAATAARRNTKHGGARAARAETAKTGARLRRANIEVVYAGGTGAGSGLPRKVVRARSLA